MANGKSECVLLDTRAFDDFLNSKDTLLKKYDEINTRYESIVNTLLQDWKGAGAAAFEDDAKMVKANITGIYDILKTMCDTLTDCRKIFEECDKALGEYNRNPKK